MNATPENTAVVTVLCYPHDQVPVTYGFMYQSAERLGIQLHVFGRNEPFESFLSAKIIRLWKWITSLPNHFQYVLFVDSRDTLFARPLADICEEFNAIGSPLIMSGEYRAYPGCHTDWEARFTKYPSGVNFHNTGGFIGHRDTLVCALRLLENMSHLLKDGCTMGYANYFEDDQHLWQLAAIMNVVPIRVDHEQRIFDTASVTPIGHYDFYKATPAAPVVLKNGSRPCILHFTGPAVCAIPYAAWTLQLVPLPHER